MSNEPKTPTRIRIGDRVTIHRRGKRGIWHADYHFAGAHCRKSLRTANRKIAEPRARALDVQLAGGEYAPQPKSMPIDKAKQAYIDELKRKGRAPKTIAKYANELKRFTAFAQDHGVRTVQRITVALFDEYQTHRETRRALHAYTAYSLNIIIKTFLNWCVRHDHLASNPLAKVALEEPRRRQHPAPTIAQVNEILSASRGTLFAVIATAAFTGLRIGEITALTPADVDLQAGVIHVTGGKTQAAVRTVPIHPRLAHILGALGKRDGRYFFNAPPSTRFPAGDHHISPRDVNDQFKDIAGGLGMSVGRAKVGLTFHALRRLFKTACIDAGVPKPLVDLWLGHAGKDDMDHHYYRPQKASQWIARVPFGTADDRDLDNLTQGDDDDEKRS